MNLPKRFAWLVFAMLFVVRSVHAQADRRPSPSDTEHAAAELVGAQVSDIIHTMMNEKPQGYHLTKVVLAMQTGNVLEKDVTINLVIFTLTHKKKIGLTDTTTLTFDDSQLTIMSTEPEPPKLDEQFKKQLDDAVAQAIKIDFGKKRTIAIKKEFVVSKDTGGGLTLKITTPVSGSAGFTLDKTKTSVNSLEFTYSNK